MVKFCNGRRRVLEAVTKLRAWWRRQCDIVREREREALSWGSE